MIIAGHDFNTLFTIIKFIKRLTQRFPNWGPRRLNKGSVASSRSVIQKSRLGIQSASIAIGTIAAAIESVDFFEGHLHFFLYFKCYYC